MKKLLSIDKAALSWIWQTLSKRKIWMLLLIVIQIANGILATERSLMLKDVIDNAVNHDRETFIQSLCILLGLFVIQLAIMSYYRHISTKTQCSIEVDLKKRLYKTLLDKDYASVKAVHSGQWNQRMTSDTSNVASLSVSLIPSFVGLFVRMAGAIIALLFLMPLLVILLIPFGFCLLGGTMIMKRTSKRMYNEIQDADGRFRVFLQEHLSNLMMVRAFGKEDMSLKEGNRVMKDHMDKVMKRNSFMIFVSVLASLAMNGMYLLGVVLGGFGILKGTITYGTFSAVISLASQAQSQIFGVSSYFSSVFNLTASAERLMAAEEYADDFRGSRSDAEVRNFYDSEFQEIQFRDAAFSYWDLEDDDLVESRVFEHLDTSIHKSEFIALTGESGCGKSTILKLLMCIYSMKAGERLLISNKQGEMVLDGSWRGLFAYVPQGNKLMQGSIRDVIVFGEEPDDSKIKESARIACAEDFINELENGFNTMLGESGSGLSEGQMQRISIARAIYSERPILLLDESTSALDSETEKKVLQNLRQMTDRTVIIVTHRPAALEVCDRVIPMN